MRKPSKSLHNQRRYDRNKQINVTLSVSDIHAREAKVLKNDTDV